MNPDRMFQGGFNAHSWIRSQLERMVGDIMRRNHYLYTIGNSHGGFPLRSGDADRADSLAELRVYEERLEVFKTTAETLLWYASQALPEGEGRSTLEECQKYVNDLTQKVRAEWLSRHNKTEEDHPYRRSYKPETEEETNNG